MSPSQKKTLRGIVVQHPLEAAYLFGSYHHGRAGRLSDVDVAVLFKKKTSYEDRQKHRIAIATEVRKVFGVKKADIIDLDQAPPLLSYEATIKGALIFSRPVFSRGIFETRVLKDYEDTRKLREVRAEAMMRRIEQHQFGKTRILYEPIHS